MVAEFETLTQVRDALGRHSVFGDAAALTTASMTALMEGTEEADNGGSAPQPLPLALVATAA